MTAYNPAKGAAIWLPEKPSRSPAEGWWTVLILAIMLAAVGIAVDDAHWVGASATGGSRTSFLPSALLLGGAWGLLGAKLRLPARRAHIIGAVIGALLIIAFVAGAMSTAPDLSARIRDLEASLVIFLDDLLVRHIRSSQVAPFLLSVGVVAWATGQFAAFAVFRRGRPLAAIVATGLAMLVNLSLTFQPEFPYLVVFASAALLLLVRSNLVKQRPGWLPRRAGEAGDVADRFMRSGVIFVAIALAGAVVLTSVASAAPLKGAFHGFDRTIVKIGDALNRIVGGVNAPARGPNALFRPDQQIPEQWVSSNEVVFRAATSDGNAYYWQATTYDAFDGQAWHQSEPVATAVSAHGDLLLATRDGPTGGGRRDILASVTAVSLGGDLLLAPAAPLIVDRDIVVWTSGPGGPLTMAEFADGLPDGQTYIVKAAVRPRHEADGGLTQYQLAAAGQIYPGWLAPYLAIEPGSVGPLTEATARSIVASLLPVQQDDFHVADAIQRYLGSTGGFSYSTDVRGLCGTQVVECFLDTKVGFCEHFATAMVMLLRELAIPSRLVMGYLPGQRQADGTWLVTQGAAHAWAEVYFPGYGWVAFDPTPGNRSNGQAPTQFDVGVPVPTPDPSAGGDVVVPGRTVRPDPTDVGSTIRTEPSSGGDPGGALVALAVLLGLGALILGLARRERGRPTQPDAVYRGVARLAGWFGHGPRPTQTVYEFATGLADVLPTMRPELQLVATAKVEATYGRREPSLKTRIDLRRAYGRLRPQLLRLALRRPR